MTVGVSKHKNKSNIPVFVFFSFFVEANSFISESIICVAIAFTRKPFKEYFDAI